MTCIQPHIDPTLLLCAPPGQGLPPLPGTPGFANRAPSYEFMVFEFATGAFIGHDHLLRPDIYEQGKPPCPQQPGGQYIYNPSGTFPFVTIRDRDSRHRTLRDAATAQVAATADQDSVRAAKVTAVLIKHCRTVLTERCRYITE